METGLTAALAIKQGRQELPHQYYHRLRKAYFGFRNEPNMEEDLNFKSLFVQNLHPTTSHHLGVAACPRTMSSHQLRELALKGFSKQKMASAKNTDHNTVLNIETRKPALRLEGAPHHEPEESPQFAAPPESRQKGPVRPKPGSSYNNRNYDRQVNHREDRRYFKNHREESQYRPRNVSFKDQPVSRAAKPDRFSPSDPEDGESHKPHKRSNTVNSNQSKPPSLSDEDIDRLTNKLLEAMKLKTSS